MWLQLMLVWHDWWSAEGLHKGVHSPSAPNALVKTYDIASHVAHTANMLGILLLALTSEQSFQATDADSSRE